MTAATTERRATEVAAKHAEGVAGLDRSKAKAAAVQKMLADYIARTNNPAGWSALGEEPPPLPRRERARRRLYRMTDGRHASDWWLLAIAAVLLLCWRLGVFAD